MLFVLFGFPDGPGFHIIELFCLSRKHRVLFMLFFLHGTPGSISAAAGGRDWESYRKGIKRLFIKNSSNFRLNIPV